MRVKPSHPTERSGVIELPVRRWREHHVETLADYVSEEWPVALVFNGISHAVMMATPRDLEMFALGFAMSEGIITHNAHVQDIDVQLHESGNMPYAEVHITIIGQAFAALKEKRRALAGRTGCGVCGIESIELLDLQPECIPDTDTHTSTNTNTRTGGFLAQLAPDAIARAARELPAHQPLTQQTGGLHAAAWCDAQGAILYAFEDIGRHNALDKLIGQLVSARADFRQGFVFLSSRASYELVRKAARMGIPMVATISAPSSLAIAIAQRAGIRLVSFCRASGYVDYSTVPEKGGR